MKMSQFNFKQFCIRQDRCAMKVGTDGVLLGAWAEGGRRILDIGTGTGLIALMMAQRFPSAQVVAIDIDAEACGQARENVLESPFSDRVEVLHSAVQDFHPPHGFDAIVSNPPFFEQSLKNPDARKALARHADFLTFQDLFSCAFRLLDDDGTFSVIIPVEKLEDFSSNAYFSSFYISRKCYIKTTFEKPSKRCLISYRKSLQTTVENSEFYLQEKDGSRSGWYRELTRDFYL